MLVLLFIYSNMLSQINAPVNVYACTDPVVVILSQTRHAVHLHAAVPPLTPPILSVCTPCASGPFSSGVSVP